MSFLPRDAAVGHISFRSLWSTQLVKWREASRGLSATAEHLVLVSGWRKITFLPVYCRSFSGSRETARRVQATTFPCRTCSPLLLARIPTAIFATSPQQRRFTRTRSPKATEKPEPETYFGITCRSRRAAVGGGNGETGTGNRFRHNVSESSYGCGTGRLEWKLVKTLSRVCETLDRGERRLDKEDRCASNRVAWQHVSLVADRLLLVIFTVGTIAVTLGVLFHAPLSRYFIFGYPDNGAVNEGRYP